MDIEAQIDSYIADQPQPKREDLQTLHRAILKASPDCRLWFLDGRNEAGKVVSNPSIGYGVQARQYAGGETREFYQVGLSANTTGISIYIMGLDDKKRLSEIYGHALGKAKITGYCVKFRKLADVSLDVIEQMVADHLGEAAAAYLPREAAGGGPSAERSVEPTVEGASHAPPRSAAISASACSNTPSATSVRSR